MSDAHFVRHDEGVVDIRSIVAKAPVDCSKEEIGDFASLVRSGAEVQASGLEELIAKAFRLFFVYQGGCLVAICALKHPRSSYRTRVAGSAGVSLAASSHPYELGWVFTIPSARRQGHAQIVVEKALDAAQGQGVFATTRSDNQAIQATLKSVGFSEFGEIYPSSRGTYHLKLFVRNQT